MKRHKRAKYMIFNVVFSSFLLISCGNHEEPKIDGVKLNKGAIIQNDDGSYKNYNLQDGKYNKIDSDETIRLYDNIDGNYVSEKSGKYFCFYNGKIKELNDMKSTYNNLKLSPSGDFISYFSDNEGVDLLHIIDSKTDTSLDLNTKVGISRLYFEWIDASHVVYYGINEDDINGIFIYDVINKVEKLYYKFDGGYIQFLKTVDAGEIFVQQTLEDKRLIRLIDKDGNDKGILSEELLIVKDVVYDGENYYVLGKTSNKIPSIYKLEDGKTKRMIYGYPSEINLDKGLSVDEAGNILFIGNGATPNSQALYTLKKDGLIKQIQSESKEYNFVKYQ